MGQWEINSKALARSTGTANVGAVMALKTTLETSASTLPKFHVLGCLSFFTDAFLLSSKLWASMYHYRQYAVFKALG
jgi:hypothetical protein